MNTSKAHSDAIEQEYDTLLALRSQINNLLGGFKQRLDLPEETKLSTCFTHVRKLVGEYTTLALNTTEMKVVIDEEANEDAVEAVYKFNLMLEKCREFKEKLRDSKPRMEEELRALEKEDVQISKTLVAVEHAKKQLKSVEEWGSHAEGIIRETEKAAEYLAGKATGLLFIH